MNTSQKRIATFRGIRPDDSGGQPGLRNPERGFRFEIIIAALPGEKEQFNSHCEQWPFERYAADGVCVAQAYCYLSSYIRAEIAPQKLAAIEADFAKARAAGVKYLLRFLYDRSEVAVADEVPRVIAHMTQLKPLLDANWDVIYALQIGWLGACGENFGGVAPEAAAEVVKGTLALLPEDRLTMVRCPHYKPMTLKLLGEECDLTAENAFTSAATAKIGFFNDATCSDFCDCGTFIDAPFYASEGGKWFDLIVRESPFMAVDGELFWTNPQQESAGAYRHATVYHAIRVLKRLWQHHYTTLSLVHNFSELDKSRHIKGSIDVWKETELHYEDLVKLGYNCSPDYFAGGSRTAFEFIRDHLGYRLEAQRITYDAMAVAGELFEAETLVVNHGMATMVNPRTPWYVLYNNAGEAIELPATPNCRHFQPWLPGDPIRKRLEHRITTACRMPSALVPGKWQLALWLPDARASLRYRSDYAVRLANNLEWVVDGAGRGFHPIGEVTVVNGKE